MVITSINHDIAEKDVEAGRYTLYLNNGCPFAHRTSIALGLKGIDIEVISSHYQFNDDGLWQFNGLDGTDLDKNNGFKTIKDLYTLSDPDYGAPAKFTVPVLWDKKTKKIVSNESGDIVRIFSTQFNSIAKNKELNFRPDNLTTKIDEFVDYYQKNFFFKIYQALDPQKYSETFDTVFATIEKLENYLGENNNTKYLFSDEITEADIKLFVVLIRFDVVLAPAFRLNWKTTRDYPNIFKYIRRLYQNPAIKPTVNFDYIKGMYYLGPYSGYINKIVSKGPCMDYLDEPIVE
ncbi:hypothetical protein ACTA71_009797 [Dictyostelium dimigraforme]